MHSPSKSVLVVDDNATVRQALRRFFETRTSMKVWKARNGSEAIEQTKAQKPDFVIMDLVMPNMNGVEAASVIRSLSEKVHIIVFTLHSDVIGKG